MGRGTGPTVALVIGAVKVGDFGIPLIEVEMQVIPAVSAYQQAGEHIFLTLMGPALADFPALFLYFLPCRPLDDRFMYIEEDSPIFTVIFQPPLIFVGLGVGLEVEHVPAIFLKRQNAGNGGAVPMAGVILRSLTGPVDAFLLPVETRRQDTVLGERVRNLLHTVSVQTHAVDAADHSGSFLVNDPTLGIIRVFLIPVGGLSHRFSGVALDLVADAALLADVPAVPFVK